jgi:hypothetical protein
MICSDRIPKKVEDKFGRHIRRWEDVINLKERGFEK